MVGAASSSVSARTMVAPDVPQTALDSRVVPEQAKGVVAQVGRLDVDQAFRVLRGYARDHNQRLTDLAGAVVDRRLPPG